jgi:predicted O-linked N-acetylglucosamine transferase (SPINDLY family)
MKKNKASAQLPPELQRELIEGYKLLDNDQYEASEHKLRLVLTHAPKNFDANYMMGLITKHYRNFEVSRRFLDKAIKAKPQMANAHSELGEVLKSVGQLKQAIWSFNRAINLEPKSGIYHNNLAGAYMDQGSLLQAKQSYLEAIKLGFYSAYSNLLLLTNYGLDLSMTEVFELHKGWDRFYQSLEGFQTKSFEFDYQHKKLRIGYVSPDFNQHSVSYFFAPLLDRHDSEKFEIYCYYSQTRIDETTRRFMEKADYWRSIPKVTDINAAQQIAEDEIDILVDLSGHTGGNRLGIFAIKPAPIQVSWLGYPNTTGLKAIDYRLTDDVADPEDNNEDGFYSEARIRLPTGFLCYRGDTAVALSEQPPCLEKGHITFGSFNNLRKVTDEVIAAWSAILKRVPDSQLLIKSKQFAFDEIKKGIIKKFNEHDIKRNRLILMDRLEQVDQHLSLYNQVDIALDTFPYNGTTTTCEALWMGVPTLTILGDCHAARVSASILSHSGMSAFIANDVDGYIEKASRFAQDVNALANIRRTIRGSLSASELCNEAEFVKNLETFYLNCFE